MYRSSDQGGIVPNAGMEIEPLYRQAIITTTKHYQLMVAFVKAQMKQDIDYGVIPGTRKPTLLKPGAEKLCRLFNLRPHLKLIKALSEFPW